MVKYNRQGDILFTTGKVSMLRWIPCAAFARTCVAERQDGIATAWWSHNGERIGTYTGHNGAVWSCDVNCEFPRPSLLYAVQLDGDALKWSKPIARRVQGIRPSSRRALQTTLRCYGMPKPARGSTLSRTRCAARRPGRPNTIVVADEKSMPDLHEGSTKPKTLILRQPPWRFVSRLVLRCGFLCIFRL